MDKEGLRRAAKQFEIAVSFVSAILALLFVVTFFMALGDKDNSLWGDVYWWNVPIAAVIWSACRFVTSSVLFGLKVEPAAVSADAAESKAEPGLAK